MNELSKSAKLYMQKFWGLKKMGCRLELYPSTPSPMGVVVAQKFRMGNPIEGNDPRVLVYNVCNRWPSKAEVFYVVGAFCAAFAERIVIPQIELTEIFKQKIGEKIFEGISSVSFNPLVIKMSAKKDKRGKQETKGSKPKTESGSIRGSNNGGGSGNNPNGSGNKKKWFHGTSKAVPSDKLVANKGSKKWDFGQGLYLTNVYSVANEYSKTNKGTPSKNGGVFEFTWSNDELDDILENIKGNTTYCDKDEVEISNGKRRFNIVIFPEKSREWSDALLEGWDGKRVKSIKGKKVDMVLGPISEGGFENVIQEYIEDLKKVGDCTSAESIKNDFYKDIQPLKLGGDLVYQLCCYNNEVIKSFSIKPTYNFLRNKKK